MEANQENTLWEFLLRHFSGVLELDRDGAIDSSISQCLAAGEEEMGFHFPPTLQLTQMQQAIRQFYEPLGFGVEVKYSPSLFLRKNRRIQSVVAITWNPSGYTKISVKPLR